jgi:hypothetical protein
VEKPVVLLSAASNVPSSGVPVLADWALDSSEAGLRRYQVQMRVAGGDWVSLGLASPTASSVRRTVPHGHEVRFRVRAIDRTGNVGDWRSSDWFVATAVSDASKAIRWNGTWSFASHASYLGRRVHWTKTSAASATLTFQGHAVAWAAPVGPTRGKARVYIDGRYVATVDLYSRTFKPRDIVFARNLGEGRHTLRIRAAGTSGRPTVALDGLYVLRER